MEGEFPVDYPDRSEGLNSPDILVAKLQGSLAELNTQYLMETRGGRPGFDLNLDSLLDYVDRLAAVDTPNGLSKFGKLFREIGTGGVIRLSFFTRLEQHRQEYEVVMAQSDTISEGERERVEKQYYRDLRLGLILGQDDDLHQPALRHFAETFSQQVEHYEIDNGADSLRQLNFSDEQLSAAERIFSEDRTTEEGDLLYADLTKLLKLPKKERYYLLGYNMLHRAIFNLLSEVVVYKKPYGEKLLAQLPDEARAACQRYIDPEVGEESGLAADDFNRLIDHYSGSETFREHEEQLARNCELRTTEYRELLTDSGASTQALIDAFRQMSASNLQYTRVQDLIKDQLNSYWAEVANKAGLELFEIGGGYSPVIVEQLAGYPRELPHETRRQATSLFEDLRGAYHDLQYPDYYDPTLIAIRKKISQVLSLGEENTALNAQRLSGRVISDFLFYNLVTEAGEKMFGLAPSELGLAYEQARKAKINYQQDIDIEDTEKKREMINSHQHLVKELIEKAGGTSLEEQERMKNWELENIRSAFVYLLSSGKDLDTSVDRLVELFSRANTLNYELEDLTNLSDSKLQGFLLDLAQKAGLNIQQTMDGTQIEGLEQMLPKPFKRPNKIVS